MLARELRRKSSTRCRQRAYREELGIKCLLLFRSSFDCIYPKGTTESYKVRASLAFCANTKNMDFSAAHDDLKIHYRIWIMMKPKAAKNIFVTSNERFLSNRPQVFMVYSLINHAGYWKNTRTEIRKSRKAGE